MDLLLDGPYESTERLGRARSLGGSGKLAGRARRRRARPDRDATCLSDGARLEPGSSLVWRPAGAVLRDIPPSEFPGSPGARSPILDAVLSTRSLTFRSEAATADRAHRSHSVRKARPKSRFLAQSPARFPKSIGGAPGSRQLCASLRCADRTSSPTPLSFGKLEGLCVGHREKAGALRGRSSRGPATRCSSLGPNVRVESTASRIGERATRDAGQDAGGESTEAAAAGRHWPVAPRPKSPRPSR